MVKMLVRFGVKLLYSLHSSEGMLRFVKLISLKSLSALKAKLHQLLTTESQSDSHSASMYHSSGSVCVPSLNLVKLVWKFKICLQTFVNCQQEICGVLEKLISQNAERYYDSLT